MKNFVGPLVLIAFVAVFINLNTNQDIKENTTSAPRGSYGFELNDITEDSGINHIHQTWGMQKELSHIERWFAYVGASVATADVNRDGLLDLFFCNSKAGEKNFFYINKGNGQFKESSREYGLDFLNSNKGVCLRPLLADFNGDNRVDLLLATTYCHQLYLQDEKGQFKNYSKESGVGDQCFISCASNIIDYDKDGDLDIVIAGYGKDVNFHQTKDYFIMPNKAIGANNGGPTVLLENDGQANFTDKTKASNLNLEGGWTLAVSVYDLNYDSYPDLWFSIDFNKSRVFMNQKGEGFKEQVNAIGEVFSYSGMGSDFSDLERNKKPYAYVSQIFSPGRRVSGNQMFKVDGTETMKNLAPEMKINTCGWSWGVLFTDLDNDGHEELLVGNGFISDNPDKDYWYNMKEVMSASEVKKNDARNWPDFSDYSLSGYQNNCLFKYDGKRFLDISNSDTFGEFKKDSRSVARVDFDNNGAMDIIVTNQVDKAVILQNKQKNYHKWIGFEFLNKSGNPLIQGSIVEVHLEKGDVLTKQAYHTNGFTTQHDPRVHFGLGKGKIKEIHITLPNKTKIQVQDYRYNRYNKIITH